MAISVYGYLKRVAAVRSVQRGQEFMGVAAAQGELMTMLNFVHDPLSWRSDVENRVKLIRLGQW
jgi:hypothetical protein